MILLFKASVILIVLLAFYKLVLERENFFASNRIYLLACLIFSIALPFITLPKLINNQGYLTQMLDIRFAENQELDTKDNIVDMPLEVEKVTAQSSVNSIEKAIENKTELSSSKIESSLNTPLQSDASNSMNWILILYLFGTIVLSFNLFAQIISLLIKAWKAKDKIEDESYVIINLKGEVEPCSFFHYIFINPTLYDYDTYEQILTHEKIHVDKRHTMDLIFSELAVIVFWFNPFVWLLRKEIEKNIEYQTDALLLDADEEIKESYQLNLVDIACRTRPLAITTNYNQSLIKQRILKMNGKRSHKFNYWKYAFVLPLLFVLVLGLNKPTEIAASGPVIPEMSMTNLEQDEFEDTLSADDESLKSVQEQSSLVDSSDEIPSEKTIVSKKTKIGSLPIVSLPKAVVNNLADCKEFEDAVARGDLVRVKQILKTLDPDCLKIAKGMLENKRDAIIADNSVNKNTSNTNFDDSICEKLELAVDNYDVEKTRSILLNEDVSCLKDIYGDPTRDESLVKGLLGYGAKMSIGNDKIIHIDDIGFKIDIPESEDDCKDPDFIELIQAIRNADRDRIRNLLTFREFDCPLGVDGKKNDFPFIKEMMKYRPEILVVNRVSVTIYGVGVDIDIHAFKDKSEGKNVAIENNKYQEAISELDRIMERGYKNENEAGCLDLLNAVDAGNLSATAALLKSLKTDCYHKVTETHTGDNGDTTTELTITPLILAAAHGDNNMIRLLLDHNADVNFQGNGTETALMYGVRSSKLSAVKILLKEKAKVNQTDDKGFTALDYAEMYEFVEIVEYLKSKGAKSGGGQAK